MALAPPTTHAAHAALPSLSTLIQGMPPQEATPHPQKPSADMTSPFESYQQHHQQHQHQHQQQHQVQHLSMPKPLLAHSTPPNFEILECDSSSTPSTTPGCSGGSSSYSMPSPISPRTTRCPSLTNSIYSSASSSTTPSLPARRSSPNSSSSNRGSFTISTAAGTTAATAAASTTAVTGRDILRYTHDRTIKPVVYTSILPHVYSALHTHPSHAHPSHAPHHAPHLPHHPSHPHHPFPPHHAHHHHEEKLSKHEKRRRNHLNSEKKRRENIKSGMDALFQLVPACRDQQESKANILRKTRDYILELQGAVGAVEAECRRLAAVGVQEEGWGEGRRRTVAGQTGQGQGKSRSRL
ncbi:hypothetical protein BZA05DRAFT_433819 [Tricharina praecox]|uniref:uncharacterized protein n=1 Tax=Tricharina praecox TaxID=43433 RepID=UPI00221ED018|nr:uncharacterized protein BZA05DRAFT_433819 [Tricharina praecox]KAI5857203.1 hypothetical protein BZA05DRAFT_433819 [Tricharina praecox]